MKIHLIATPEILDTLETGVRLLATDFDIELTSEGVPVYVEQRNGPLIINKSAEKHLILYDEMVEFYRALGIIIQNNKYGEFEIIEEKNFKTTGVMPDLSRNAVLKKEQLYFFLRKMAVMGLNTLLLYIEDVYEIEDEPYFGYMRGRYTQEELKQVDDYAHALGIEVIPAIQTLAHLQTALRWNDRRNIKDTEDILLVGEKETYRFIDKMITAATRPFRTKRIHIGMDEAMDLGLGRYLELNNYHHRFGIMMKHLDEVMKLTTEKELEPMIWSDMFFRIASKNNEYYDEEGIIPQEVVNKIPREVKLVYWDYYHSNQEHYQLFLKKHKELGSHPIFTGGAWTWNGIAPNYGRAFVNSEAALKACKSEGIEEVFLTLWADNGAETPLTTALPVMQLYAEYTYKAGARIDTAISRIEFWLKDEGVIIEELEVNRLIYDAKYDIVEGFLGTEKYHHIVTTGHLSH